MAASNNAQARVAQRRLLPMTMLNHSMRNLPLCMAAFLYRCIALQSDNCCCAAAADPTASNRYECWARSQMKYVLGSDDGVGHSFVVGFGKNPPVQAHHRAASCPDPPALCSFDNFNSATANPHTLFGALVGGETLCHCPVCLK